jgi:hypothetical protein
MNIWEFLGFPSDHRPEDKTVQLVKHHEDVIKKITYPRIAQVKKDGVFALVVMDKSKVAIFGRTGRELQSVQHLCPEPSYGNGRVAFIAELCCDTCSLEELSGIVNPNRKKPLDMQQQWYINDAYLTVHDMVYLSELIVGHSYRDYNRRYMDMVNTLCGINHCMSVIACTQCDTAEEIEEFSKECIADGEEGAVFKDPEAGWVAGRKNEVATKIVKGVDFDLQVTGIKEGKGKHSGMVGKLVVRWCHYGTQEGITRLLPVDGCFTQEMRKAWFADPSEILGKIVHVHALCIGSKGALRLPKVKSVRIDKTVADL